MMLIDDLSRELTPEQRSAVPECLLGRVAMTLGFTIVQLWAIFELASLNSSGTVLVALVVIIAAAILVTAEAWREVFRLVLTVLRTPRNFGREAN